MLELAWVLPAITFTSFWVILFIGKRLPKGGSEIGVLLVGVTLVLASVMAFQWIDRDKTLPVTHGGEHAAGEEEAAGAPGSVRLAVQEGDTDEEHAEESEEIRKPVVEEVTWFTIGDTEVKVGTHMD